MLQFLWVQDINQEPSQIKVMRFKRVVFGVTCSPYLLNATLTVHLEKLQNSCPVLVKQIKESLYVDDVVCGTDTIESAYQFYLESRELLKSGEFNLHKFVTNCVNLTEKIKPQEDPSLMKKE